MFVAIDFGLGQELGTEEQPWLQLLLEAARQPWIRMLIVGLNSVPRQTLLATVRAQRMDVICQDETLQHVDLDELIDCATSMLEAYGKDAKAKQVRNWITRAWAPEQRIFSAHPEVKTAEAAYLMLLLKKQLDQPA